MKNRNNSQLISQFIQAAERSAATVECIKRNSEDLRKALLEASRRIFVYKLMQAKGYERLVSKAADERTRQLLATISASELGDAEFWSQKIGELAGTDRKSGKASFLSQKVSPR